MLLLELGVGFNTPTIIRFPLEEITLANPPALLVRMNRETVAPGLPIRERTVNMAQPMAEALECLLAAKQYPAA